MPVTLDILRKARAVLLRRGVPICDVDDVVHDAFVRVEQYERAQLVRSREAVLVKTAINISIDADRRKRRSPFISSSNGIEQIINPEPQPDQVAEARARLRRANDGLNRLDARSRRILLSRRLDNLSVAQIAEREEMSIAAVEKQIARATLSLMKWMDGW